MSEFEEIKRMYDKIAEAYHIKRQTPEDATWNDYLESPAMEKTIAPLVKDKRVLDLGCGTGLLTRKIAEWGGEVRGLDLSDNMIEIACKESPEIDFRVGSTEAIPFEDNSFDIVASSLVMHYIKELRPSFEEIGRILKRGGDFVFSMHHPFQESFDLNKSNKNGDQILRPYFNNDKYYWKMCGEKIPSFHHTFEKIVKSLKEAGFVLKDLVECRPVKSAKELFGDFEYTSKYPTFCVFHTVLQ